MAQQTNISEHDFRYQKYSIFKDKPLGHGSYGAVYKAMCDQLPCAAKVLHPTIVDHYDPGSGKIRQRFQQECDFLNSIRHPNIVQYLGMCMDMESNLPALLMELLDESLTSLLERSESTLPCHVQVDLCHDISLAIAYLHSNEILHRDLSSNNVLVIAGRRAKVTDFGMSKISATNVHLTPLTQCPGTVAYMSPEAFKMPPSYTKKLDIFSQGVIMIQVCTGLFPEPGPAVEEVQDSRSVVGVLQIPVPETERRKNHIKMINEEHPLLPIAKTCLNYQGKDRPSADDLCHKLALVKEKHPKYLEAKQNAENPQRTEETKGVTAEKDEVIEALRNELATQNQEKMEEIEQKDHEIMTKNQEIAVKGQEIERLQAQVQNLSQRLQENERIVVNFEETNEKLLGQVEDLHKQLAQSNGPSPRKEDERPISLLWEPTTEEAPMEMRRGSSVVNGSIVYFRSGSGVYAYDSIKKVWRSLPHCEQKMGSLAIVHDFLVMIGGKQTHNGVLTDKLLNLIDTESGMWVEQLPPMPTKRLFATAITYLNHLIVAGGSSTGRVEHNTDIVEVLNTSSLVWSRVANLPHTFGAATAAICGDLLYMLGGNDAFQPRQSVLVCSLTELISSQNHSEESHHGTTVWKREANLPLYYSTCAEINGQLVSLGGQDPVTKAATSTVYKYSLAKRSWSPVGRMLICRYKCYVAVVRNGVIVVGGEMDKEGTMTDSIELAVAV